MSPSDFGIRFCFSNSGRNVETLQLEVVPNSPRRLQSWGPKGMFPKTRYTAPALASCVCLGLLWGRQMLGFIVRPKSAGRKVYFDFKVQEHRAVSSGRLARNTRACKGVSSCDSRKMRIIRQERQVIYSNMRRGYVWWLWFVTHLVYWNIQLAILSFTSVLISRERKKKQGTSHEKKTFPFSIALF